MGSDEDRDDGSCPMAATVAAAENADDESLMAESALVLTRPPIATEHVIELLVPSEARASALCRCGFSIVAAVDGSARDGLTWVLQTLHMHATEQDHTGIIHVAPTHVVYTSMQRVIGPRAWADADHHLASLGSRDDQLAHARTTAACYCGFATDKSGPTLFDSIERALDAIGTHCRSSLAAR